MGAPRLRVSLALLATILGGIVGCEPPPATDAPPASSPPEQRVADPLAPGRFFAHRGLSTFAPENTRLAVELAAERGFDKVEIDVRTTSDDEIVVFHDETLQRFTQDPRPICEVSSRELTAVDPAPFYLREILRVPPNAVDAVLAAGDPWVGKLSGAGVVTLDQMFAAVGKRVTYHLDVKRFGCTTPMPVMLMRLVELIERHGLEDHVYVESTDLTTLALVRAMNPRIRLLLWRDDIFRAPDDFLALIRRAGVAGVDLASVEVDPAARGRLAGLSVHTFTVNSVPEMTKLAPAVDYVLTDLDVASGEMLGPHDFFNRRATAVRIEPPGTPSSPDAAEFRTVTEQPVRVLVRQ